MEPAVYFMRMQMVSDPLFLAGVKKMTFDKPVAMFHMPEVV